MTWWVLFQMTAELKALYKDDVVVQVVTLPLTVEQSDARRKTRSLLQDDGDDDVSRKHGSHSTAGQRKGI